LVALYRKKIPGFPSASIPDVPVQSPYEQLPTTASGSVKPTGAIYHALLHDDTLDNHYLAATVTAGGGAPEVILVENPLEKSRKVHSIVGGTTGALTGFKKGDSGLVILTDTSPQNESAGTTSVDAQLSSPRIEITNIDLASFFVSSFPRPVKFT